MELYYYSGIPFCLMFGGGLLNSSLLQMLRFLFEQLYGHPGLGKLGKDSKLLKDLNPRLPNTIYPFSKKKMFVIQIACCYLKCTPTVLILEVNDNPPTVSKNFPCSFIIIWINSAFRYIIRVCCHTDNKREHLIYFHQSCRFHESRQSTVRISGSGRTDDCSKSGFKRAYVFILYEI